MARDFAALGVTVEPDEAAVEAVEVWSVNGDVVRLFLDLSTQWRAAAGFGALVWLGLDYLVVDMMLRRRNLGDDALADLQVMEQEALPILNERAS